MIGNLALPAPLMNSLRADAERIRDSGDTESIDGLDADACRAVFLTIICHRATSCLDWFSTSFEHPPASIVASRQSMKNRSELSHRMKGILVLRSFLTSPHCDDGTEKALPARTPKLGSERARGMITWGRSGRKTSHQKTGQTLRKHRVFVAHCASGAQKGSNLLTA